MQINIVSIRENAVLSERGVDYLSSTWGIERRIYDDCIAHSITTENPLPRWYLMMKEDEIIGSYGLITNDFISRQDLYPWLCALYLKVEERGKALGETLLNHGINEAKALGFKTVYLATDHIGYYEKYGWEFIGMGYHPWGDASRIYKWGESF